MKIIINGIEPHFKIYKMSECIKNKFYIGKTKQSLKDRMNGHRHGGHSCVSADNHFADIGWRNVTVEIIDQANNDDELILREEEQIKNNASDLMLNKNLNSNEKMRKPIKNKNVYNTCIITSVCRYWSEVESKWITKEQK